MQQNDFITLSELSGKLKKPEMNVRRKFLKLIKQGKFIEGEDYYKEGFLSDHNLLYKINFNSFLIKGGYSIHVNASDIHVNNFDNIVNKIDNKKIENDIFDNEIDNIDNKIDIKDNDYKGILNVLKDTVNILTKQLEVKDKQIDVINKQITDLTTGLLESERRADVLLQYSMQRDNILVAPKVTEAKNEPLEVQAKAKTVKKNTKIKEVKPKGVKEVKEEPKEEVKKKGWFW